MKRKATANKGTPAPGGLQDTLNGERRESSVGTTRRLDPEAQRLMHELQVHQIELLQQNEELQQARHELEKSLARYTDLYDQAPVGYMTLNREGTIQQINRVGMRLLGIEKVRLPSPLLFRHSVTEESRTAFDTFLSKVFSGGCPEPCEIVVRVAGTRPLAVELTGTADTDGRECRIAVTDISVRKRAEQLLALRLRLQEFAAAHTLQELLRRALDEVEHLTGGQGADFYSVDPSRHTVSREAWSSRVHREYPAIAAGPHSCSVEVAGVRTECVQLRLAVVHNSSHPLPAGSGIPETSIPIVRELAVPVLRHDNVVAILGVCNKPTDFTSDDVDAARFVAELLWDLSELKRSEREQDELRSQLAQSQKMEAIGTLAGGIAHDFNNIMGGVLAGLSLLELELQENHELSGHIGEMKSMVERGADLTQRLLGFARRGKYHVQPIDLAAAVERICAIFGRTRKDLIFQLCLAPELRPVLMDQTQLEQVLLNLLVNAGQAMPEGGRVKVDAENAELDANDAAVRGLSAGSFAKLIVADTGVGMDTATQARIFEPFFTTKGTGHGTGLGLASVYGIVKCHSGVISVRSTLGSGTEFTLFLPTTDRPLPAAKPASTTVKAGAGTLLVVDDEEVIVKFTSRILRRMGYSVLTATGGQDALDLVRQHGEGISLVILDLIMPNMSGGQTFDALQRVVPGIKVLLSSGYSIDGQAQEILSRGCNGFIQKPFDATTLSEKLREIL